MAMEYCHTDLAKMLTNKAQGYVFDETIYSGAFVLRQAIDISNGMAYMIDQGHSHLDLKPVRRCFRPAVVPAGLC